MKNLVLVLGCLALTWATDWPSWPEDFRGSSEGPILDHCILTTNADDYFWGNFYICWRGINLSIRWQATYNARGYTGRSRCLTVFEGRPYNVKLYPNSHNLLCNPSDYPYEFHWSTMGAIPGMSCIPWRGIPHGYIYLGSDSHYLCSPPTNPNLPYPVFPQDFLLSYNKIPQGYDCLQLVFWLDTDSLRPLKFWSIRDWANHNYICWRHGTKDPGMKMFTGGRIAGKSECPHGRWLCPGVRPYGCGNYHCRRCNDYYSLYECSGIFEHRRRCIPQNWLCDGRSNCWDDQDEAWCDMHCTHIDYIRHFMPDADKDKPIDTKLCVPSTSTLRFVWSDEGPLEDHGCLEMPYHSGYFLCGEKCEITKMEILGDNEVTAMYDGSQVVGLRTGGGCLGSTKNLLTLSSLESVTDTTSVSYSETEEFNWSASYHAEFTLAVKFLGTGSSFSAGWTIGGGGSSSFTSTDGSSSSEGESTSGGQSTYYDTPGAALLLGVKDRYRIDATDIPAKMYFQCPISGSYSKETTISVSAQTYQHAHFEAMVGRFYEEACEAANNDLASCVRNIGQTYRSFFGDLTGVREAFLQCFADGKGTV